MNLGTLPHLRWSSLQKLVMVGYLHVAMVTQPSLQTKLKLDENAHALKVMSDTIPCFVDMFLNVLKTPITFCFINTLLHFEINYRNDNWYQRQFHLLGFY